MPRNPAVLVQIQSVDAMFKRTGVQSFCLDCIRGPKGGCCQACSLLGTEGCTNKPLSCTLWVCESVERVFPDVARELAEIKHQWPAPVSYGLRQSSLEAEERLLNAG